MGYVRYRFNNNVHEDILFCMALERDTQLVKQFFLKLVKSLKKLDLSGKTV